MTAADKFALGRDFFENRRKQMNKISRGSKGETEEDLYGSESESGFHMEP